MEYKELEHYGNDCMIHKTVSVMPIGSKYAVTILQRAEGNWIDKDDLDIDTMLFNTEKEATEYYNSIN